MQPDNQQLAEEMNDKTYLETIWRTKGDMFYVNSKLIPRYLQSKSVPICINWSILHTATEAYWR